MGNNILEAQIAIESKKDATWQGVLCVGKQEYKFISELDLLFLINKLVGGVDGYIGWDTHINNTCITNKQEGI